MLELLREPIVLPYEPPSKANIAFDYRLKNVPAHLIRNKGLAAKKRRLDMCNTYKDVLAYTVKAKCTWKVLRCAKVAIHLSFYFAPKSKKKPELNPALLKKDCDNVEKLVWDALEAAGLFEGGDHQVCHHITDKYIDADLPRLVIHSIAVIEKPADLVDWLQARAVAVQAALV